MIRACDITPLGALPGFCLLTRAAWERAEPGYRRDVARRGRENGIVQITLAGCGWCRRGDGPVVPVPPGTAMIFHMRQHRDLVYGMGEGDVWEFLYTDLDGAAAASGIADLVAAHGHVLPLAATHPAVRACARMVPRTPLTHRSLPAAESARLGGGLLLALAEAAIGDPDPLAAAAMAWLRARLDRPLGIAACAAALGVSREHLTRVFVRAAGEGPARWLLRQRLALARVLLLEPGATVAGAARTCGFASPAHFAQVFRRQTGESPLAWAQRRRAIS